MSPEIQAELSGLFTNPLFLLFLCLFLPSIGFALSVIAGGQAGKSTHRPYSTKPPGYYNHTRRKKK